MSAVEKVLLSLAFVFLGASFGAPSQLASIHLTLIAISLTGFAIAIR